MHRQIVGPLGSISPEYPRLPRCGSGRCPVATRTMRFARRVIGQLGMRPDPCPTISWVAFARPRATDESRAGGVMDRIPEDPPDKSVRDTVPTDE